jgi:thioredoxin 2
MAGPPLERLATEQAGELTPVGVDVDAASRSSQRFEVRAVPTVLVLCSWLDGALAGGQAS